MYDPHGRARPAGPSGIIRRMSARRSVVSSAKLIALCTLLSRITGLVRDVLLAQAFGLGRVQDAFAYAFQFPNLFRRLFGEGAMAPAFVPTFTHTLEHEGRHAAWRLLAHTLALLTVTLAGLILAIGVVLAAIALFPPQDPTAAEARRLLLSLTALMLPFMLLVCLLALLSSILNCVGSFVPAALAPVLLNLFMITAAGWAGPLVARRLGHDPGEYEGMAVIAYTVGVAVLAAGVAQLAFVYPALRARGVPLGWRLSVEPPAVRRMLKLLAPVAVGQGVLAFGVFLDTQVCWMFSHVRGTPELANWLGIMFRYPLDEGALGALSYAQRLYQFPLGVLVISLGTAALPEFSRLAARQEWPAWTAEVRQSLRLAVFEGLLAGVMMIVLAVPLVRLLFERGQFTAADTQRAAFVVRWYGVGLWAFCAQHIVLRGFYSLGDARTPLRISLVLLPLNVLLNVLLIWVPAVREAGFAISTTVTSGLAVITGLFILQRRGHARVFDGPTLGAILRMIAAAAATAAVLWIAAPPWQSLAARLPGTLTVRAVETLGLLAIGTLTFLAAAWLLRLNELELLVVRRRRA